MTTISWGADEELDKGENFNTKGHQRASGSAVVKVREFDALFAVDVHDAKEFANDDLSSTIDSGLSLKHLAVHRSVRGTTRTKTELIFF